LNVFERVAKTYLKRLTNVTKTFNKRYKNVLKTNQQQNHFRDLLFLLNLKNIVKRPPSAHTGFPPLAHTGFSPEINM